MTDADDNIQFKLFDTYFAGLPAATTPLGAAPMLVLQGTTKQVPANDVGTVGRTLLTANTNFYVATTGSDSNPGTLASPWATLQHAMNFISADVDGGGFMVTVNIGAGSFIGLEQLTTVGILQFNWLGAGQASTTITVDNSGLACLFVNAVLNHIVFIDGVLLKLNNALASGAIVNFIGGQQIQLGGLISGSSDMGYTFNGGANQQSMILNEGPFAVIYMVGGTHTIHNSGATSVNAFYLGITQGCFADFATFTSVNNGSPDAYAPGGGFLVISGGCLFAENSFGTPPTNGPYAGVVATGPRFFILSDSECFNASAAGFLGPNLFPGNVAGTCDSSSFYDGFPGPQPNNTRTSNYTLQTSDVNGIVEMNLAGANTVTVPLDAPFSGVTGFFEPGNRIIIVQIGAGATTVAAAGGVTVHNAGALSGQWGAALLYRRGANEWVQVNY